MVQLQGKPELNELFADAIRPSRSVAFERTERDQAIKAFPELVPVYDVFDAASRYIVSKGYDGEDQYDHAGRQSIADSEDGWRRGRAL